MKCRVLSLGMGYAETASWAQLTLVHPVGFKTVQDALISVYDSLYDLLVEEIGDAKAAYDRSIAGGHKPYVSEATANAKPEDEIEEALRIIIGGSFQDYGMFWEHISGRGWLVGLAWINQSATKWPIVGVNNAPEMVVAAKRGSDVEGTVVEFQNQWAISSYFEIPKGIKLFNKKPDKQVQP